MKAIVVALAMSVLSTGAFPQARESFDLVCEGATTSGMRSNLKTASWVRRIRVDLASGKFCYDSCPEIFNVAEVNEQAVYFSKTADGNYMLVDRSTGHITGRILILGFRHDTDADCLVEAFSGMSDRRLF